MNDTATPPANPQAGTRRRVLSMIALGFAVVWHLYKVSPKAGTSI